MKPFELSPPTDKLVSYLRLMEKGTQVTYGELSSCAETKITGISHHLAYARRILERDHNAIWICIRPGVGVRRLTDPEIAERLPHWWLRGARNKLRRGGHQTNVVETNQLDADQQTRFAVDSIQQQLAFESLSRATRKRMDKVARGTSNDLPSFNILEWAITLMPRKQSDQSK